MILQTAERASGTTSFVGSPLIGNTMSVLHWVEQIIVGWALLANKFVRRAHTHRKSPHREHRVFLRRPGKAPAQHASERRVDVKQQLRQLCRTLEIISLNCRVLLVSRGDIVLFH